MYYRNNKITVNLNKLTDNYNNIVNSLSNNIKLMAVIKADAYGHGLIPVAKHLKRSKCFAFCVALVEEGEQIRQAGIDTPIFLLGISSNAAYEPAIKNDLVLTVYTKEQVREIQRTAKLIGKKAKIQIAINTGMNRIGLNTKDELIALLYFIEQSDMISLISSFTHLAHADQLPEKMGYINDFTINQINKYQDITSAIDNKYLKSLSNSAGIIRIKDVNIDTVRAGIMMYGYPPVKTNINLTPIMEWTSEILCIREVPRGETIGYSCTYTAKENIKVATVATGYGDGYKRAFSNKSRIIINNEYAPVIGNVCMDQIMVDVSHVKTCFPGDEAVLLGKRADKCVDAEELARLADTISYEILLAPSQRVRREYIV